MVDPKERIKSITVICDKCKKESLCGISFEDVGSFVTSFTEGNIQNCSHCRPMQIISCNKSNMKYVLENGEGGFIGDLFAKVKYDIK